MSKDFNDIVAIKRIERETKQLERQKNNLEIIDKLKGLIIANPDARFCQLLYNSNIIDGEDRFYEEPEETLKRMQ